MLNSDLKLKERVKRGELTPQEALRILAERGERKAKIVGWLLRRAGGAK